MSSPGRRSVKRAAPGDVRTPDRLLNVHEAAALLALKPATLYQWAYERRLPVVKLFGPRGALRFRHLRREPLGGCPVIRRRFRAWKARAGTDAKRAGTSPFDSCTPPSMVAAR